MNYIKSPLNYTGNKHRLLPQLFKYFPNKIDIMVDLFCGGGTVGLNTKCNKVIFIDNNERVINLLKFLSTISYERVYEEIMSIINKYKLSCSALNSYAFYKKLLSSSNNSNNGLKEYNIVAYNTLREDYNNLEDKTTHYANLLLYILMIYAFNNDIRFSKSGNFNLPAGKTDMNKINLTKLENFIYKMKTVNCEFICETFQSEKILPILLKADFIYMDPPYLITTAVYNESNKWNDLLEEQLLKLLDFLLENKKQFILSNILEKQSSVNTPLLMWIKDNSHKIEIIDINSCYKSASYNKKNRNLNEKEVIIKTRI